MRIPKSIQAVLLTFGCVALDSPCYAVDLSSAFHFPCQPSYGGGWLLPLMGDLGSVRMMPSPSFVRPAFQQ
jgi:hypothetical protein